MQAPSSSSQGRDKILPQQPAETPSSFARLVASGVLGVFVLFGFLIFVHTVLNHLGFEVTGAMGLLVSLGVTLALLASVGAILFLIDKRSSPAPVSDPAGMAVQPEIEFQPPQLSVPEVPDVLAKRCAEGSCVLVAGTGLSSQAGHPTWSTFTKELLNAALKFDVIEKTSEASLHQLLKHNSWI